MQVKIFYELQTQMLVDMLLNLGGPCLLIFKAESKNSLTQKRETINLLGYKFSCLSSPGAEGVLGSEKGGPPASQVTAGWGAADQPFILSLWLF